MKEEKKPTIFSIKEEFLELYGYVDDEESMLEEAFVDTLNNLKGELEEKSSGYAALIFRFEDEAKRAEEMAKMYSAYAKRRKAAIKYMKDNVMSVMDDLGLNEMPAGDVTIKIQKNGGVQPLVIDGEVPDNMMKVIYEPDNEKIREYLKENTCEYAHLEERGRHIVIK